jgi:hypothetical protein
VVNPEIKTNYNLPYLEDKENDNRFVSRVQAYGENKAITLPWAQFDIT